MDLQKLQLLTISRVNHMKEFKYKTSFSSQVKSVISEERDKYLSLASLVNIGDFITDVDIQANVDLIPVAYNNSTIMYDLKFL